MLIPNPRGNFHFTKGSPFYASAVVADPGFQIVRAILEKPVPLNAGFDVIRRELQSCGRPLQALCGMELRTQDPYPNRPLFMDFNSKYVDRLKSLDLLVDGLVPITRANLAVHDRSVTEQCVYAFLYTVPSKTQPSDFCHVGDCRFEKACRRQRPKCSPRRCFAGRSQREGFIRDPCRR